MLFTPPPTIDLPRDCGDPKEAVVAMLVRVGLDEDNAHRLVEDELTFTPALHIPLLDLPITSVEKRVAEKLLRCAPLTDEERDVLIVVPIIRVEARKPRFRERAADYCGGQEVATRLFAEVFKPLPQYRGGCCVFHGPPIRLLPGPR
jgi:hypothetical protein